MAVYGDQIVDLSPVLNLEQRVPRIITSLNLFSTDYHATDLIEVDRDVEAAGIIPARERNGERNWLTDNRPNGKIFRAPFFPLDHNIKPVDVQSFRDFLLRADELETIPATITRYTTKIQRAIDRTKERIFTASIMGYAFTGSTGSVNSAYNYYDEWGVTQQSIAIDFTSTTVDPASVIEAEARGYIVDQRQDDSATTTVICLCGRQFFAAITSNAFTRAAYSFYQGTPNPLRDRISGNANFQTFEYKGVIYVEVDSDMIATDEAYLLPTDVDGMLQAHYAPADTIGAANQVAADQYLFMIETLRTVQLQSDFSLLAVNTRPELVVHLTMA